MHMLQLKQRRQVHRQPREINDDGQCDNHNKNEWKDRFRNLFQGYVGDVANNVKIHRHRRSQLADSQVDCHDNAEPDGVPVEDLDERDQNREENVVDGNRIHEHTGYEQHDVDQDEKDSRIRGQGEKIAGELVHDSHGGTSPGIEAGKCHDDHDDRRR